MRGTERMILLVAIAVPLGIALIGWPLFVNWLARPAGSAEPVVAGVAITPTAGPIAAATPPAARTAEGPAARAATAAVPATPAIASKAVEVSPTNPGAPDDAVATFYGLVSSHQFDTAASLWSDHLRTAFPIQENIYQRFNQTQSIELQRADIISQDTSRATVAVDVVEVLGHNSRRRYLGTWEVIRGANGWLLDQPNLQAAP